MDYEAEQAMEIEALESIFMDDLQEYAGSLPTGWEAVGKTYLVAINPFEEGEEVEGHTDEELKMELLFAHTPTYPETGPSLKLQSVYGLTDAEVARCTAELQSQVEQNLGMAMIYTLIAAAKEWLRNRASQTLEEDPAIATKKALAEEEARRAAARLMGTPVTLQSFKEWKARFDAEMALEKAKVIESAKDDEKAKRITGRAWFSQDRSEVATEAGALSEDDEEDFDLEGEEEEEGADDEVIDEDYEDDDDEGMLDEL